MKVHAEIACPLGDAYPSSFFTPSPSGQGAIYLPRDMYISVVLEIFNNVVSSHVYHSVFVTVIVTLVTAIFVVNAGVVVAGFVVTRALLFCCYGIPAAAQPRARRPGGLRPAQLELLFVLQI